MPDTGMTSPRRALLVADFNAATLAGYLANDGEQPLLVPDVASAGTLGAVARGIDGQAERSAGYDVCVVWTRPEAVSASFAALMATGDGVVADVLADVDDFAARVADLGRSIPRVLVATWQPPRLNSVFGALAMRPGGMSHVVMQMNLRLAERLGSLPGVTCVDSAAWMPAGDAHDARLWYAAKIPFKNEVFRRATREIKSLVRASLGESRKLLVLDLDDTLWGGLVGEVGWQALRLGGHDPVGEAHVDFQRTLAALSKRGILLAIASKNDERVALAAIEQHPEMVLRTHDFAAWRINWRDKAENIADLARDLNLGLNSIVFIDDSPAERARVREALPEVLVPEWPATPLLYVDHLLSLRCFETLAVTDEDRRRTELYAREKERTATRQGAESVEEWMRRLGVRVHAEELNERNATRAVQLLNKTNQMNLSTRRLGAGELTAWLRDGRRKLWTYRVHDRFGDAGLTGIASLDVQGRAAVLVDFILSCRVFGRGIERTMMHHVTQSAADLGAGELVVPFQPTEKNGPCLQFLRDSGLRQDSEHVFGWALRAAYPLPVSIELVRAEPETVA